MRVFGRLRGTLERKRTKFERGRSPSSTLFTSESPPQNGLFRLFLVMRNWSKLRAVLGAAVQLMRVFGRLRGTLERKAGGARDSRARVFGCRVSDERCWSPCQTVQVRRPF